MVGQYSCMTKLESQIPEGVCPNVFRGPSEENKCGLKSNVHLFRDISGVSLPQILFTKYNSGTLSMFLLQLTSYSREWYNDYVNMAETQMIMTGPTSFLDVKEEETLFDTRSRLLYIFNPRKPKSNVRLYFLTIGSNGKPSAVYQSMHNIHQHGEYFGTTRVHANNKGRSQWTEDPYSGMVYYVEEVEGVKGVFSAPFSLLPRILFDGIQGTQVSVLEKSAQIVSVSGDVIISREIVKNGLNTTVTTSIRNLNTTISGKGFRCPFQTRSVPSDVFSSVIIRDWDHCLLEGKTREMCHDEKREWMIEKGLIKDVEGELNVILWLVLVLILLSVLVVLLFIYIYWLRSTFATVDESPREHDKWNSQYHEEASMFMSKQRSFPSAYPDPALLDVSVDRWN